MEKLTFERFRDIMSQHNKTSKGRQASRTGVIVFKQDSFTQVYTETERSYRVSSQCNMFNARFSSSLFGSCLDGTESGVRLDWYMFADKNPWQVEFCYLEK